MAEKRIKSKNKPNFVASMRVFSMEAAALDESHLPRLLHLPPWRGILAGLDEARVVAQDLHVIECERRRRMARVEEREILRIVSGNRRARRSRDVHRRDGLPTRIAI